MLRWPSSSRCSTTRRRGSACAAPIPGWEIREANPLAAWLFDRVGLVEGLAIDTLVTALAVVILVAIRVRLPRAARLALLGLLIGTSAFAVANNLDVIQQIGLLGGNA